MSDTGRTQCASCLVAATAPLRFCDACGARHHLACWDQAGGCAEPGCRRRPQPATGPSSSPDAVMARMAGWARSLGPALQTGWRPAAVPALGAYLTTLAVAFLTLGSAALLSADRLDGGGVVLAAKVALAGVAMAFRGALVLGGASPSELTPGGDWRLVAPPLGLALVAVAALVWFTRRRPVATGAADAFRIAICFAGMVGGGALLVRTSRDVLSLGDLTVRVAVPGAVFWATVVGFAATWLATPGRCRRLVREAGGERLAPWRLPVAAGVGTVAAIWVAAMAAAALYGTFQALTESGMTGGERVAGLLAGLTFLPVVAAFGAGIAGGANLVGPGELGYDRLVLGWFGERQPDWWWAFATLALVALAVAGAWWLAQRVPGTGPWRPAFVTGFTAAWTAMALSAQFVLQTSGGTMMTFGLGMLGTVTTGVLIGLVAVGAGGRLGRRAPAPPAIVPA